MKGRCYSAWRETFYPTVLIFVLNTVYWNYCVLIPKFLKRQNRQISTADGECTILMKSIPRLSIVRRSLPQYAAHCVDALPISRNFLHSVMWLQSLFLFELKFMHFPNPLKLGTLLRYFSCGWGKSSIEALRHIRCNFKSTLLFIKVYKGTDGTLIPISSECKLIRYHLLDNLYRNIL